MVSSCDFNKLVIKAKMHAKTFFLLKIQYDFFIIHFLERLGRMHENKTFFSCFDKNQVFQYMICIFTV